MGGGGGKGGGLDECVNEFSSTLRVDRGENLIGKRGEKGERGGEGLLVGQKGIKGRGGIPRALTGKRECFIVLHLIVTCEGKEGGCF